MESPPSSGTLQWHKMSALRLHQKTEVSSAQRFTQLCWQTGLAEGEQSRRGRLTWEVQFLTVVVNQKGNVGGQDLIVADLAVLRRAVSIDGLHAQDAVVELALGHCHAVQLLHKDRSKLVDVVHANVHCGPGAGKQHCDHRLMRSHPSATLQVRQADCQLLYRQRPGKSPRFQWWHTGAWAMVSHPRERAKGAMM